MKTKPIKPTHILLVEDNEGDVLLTMEAFEECEIEIETKISVAKNGQEALDFLYQRSEYANVKKPDLILLDINMPIFSGHEVLERIKSDPNLKKIPVIMLTTSSNQKDITKAYENHCNGYIKKPLDISEFMEAILKIEDFRLKLTTLSD
jgi:CheY-like chemotaxis protein